jgi:LPS export ABC transporter protein LptC
MKLAFTLAAALCLAAAGCEERVHPDVRPLTQTEIPDQESWNSTVRFSDSARVKAVLWAGHIAAYSHQKSTLLSDSIHVDFYNEQELHTSVLTARWGKVNEQTQDFEAHENVVVVSDSGTILRTDRLFWDNAERKIHTDAFVDIVSPTEHIMGHGMVSDQSLRNYRIFKVTGQRTTND